MGCIYMWTNLINMKRYIGKCKTDAKKRYRAHINGHGNKPLKQAIDKYGIEHFSFDILHKNIPHELLNDYEMEAIAQYNTNTNHPGGWGYNLTHGGDGNSMSGKDHPLYGKPPSAETKQKLSESAKSSPLVAEAQRKATEAAAQKNRGTPRSEETKQKISTSHIGITHSEETIAKHFLGDNNPMYGKPSPNRGKPSPMKGIPRSEETKAKISQSLMGREFTDEHRSNISASQTGEKNNNYGKPRSAETCRKIGKANSSPYKPDAHALFFSLPKPMPLREKRKILCEKFPDVAYGTIHGWTCQWQPEGISRLKDSREVFAHKKAIAHDIFKSLFPTASLREIRKILREKFSDYDKSTVYKWIKQWQSELDPQITF